MHQAATALEQRKRAAGCGLVCHQRNKPGRRTPTATLHSHYLTNEMHTRTVTILPADSATAPNANPNPNPKARGGQLRWYIEYPAGNGSCSGCMCD